MVDSSRIFSIAPMMGWTDTHYRTLVRTLTKRTLLYTEMVSANALCHGDVERHLSYNMGVENPIAVQLAGSDVKSMAMATQHCNRYNFDEINFNVGCPSARAQKGNFGAILLQQPLRVAECLRAMQDNTDKAVSVKHRIGLGFEGSYDSLRRFIEGILENCACTIFIIHARASVLKGLNPKENRSVPPLQYDVVYRIKKEFPHIKIVVNGGMQSLRDVKRHLDDGVDGVMVGRSAYHRPYDLLATVDRDIFERHISISSRVDVIKSFLPYVQDKLRQGVPLHVMIRHTLGMFSGCVGGRKYRRILSENMYQKGAGTTIMEEALSAIDA